MVEYIGTRKQKLLVEDILSAKYDVVSLAKRHQLSPRRLSDWIGESENHRILQGLCVLADIQAQLLLSRYRLVAAGRLIKMATQDDEGDLVRKSCVDLLKLDLKGARGGDVVGGREAEILDEDVAGKAEGLASLREKLYERECLKG